MVPDMTTIVLDTTTILPDTSTVVLDMAAGALDTTTIIVDTTMIMFDTSRTIVLDTTTTVFDTTKTTVFDTTTIVFDTMTIVLDTTTIVFDTTRIVFDDRVQQPRPTTAFGTTTIVQGTMTIMFDMSTIALDTTTIVPDTTTIMSSDTTTIVLETTTIVPDTTTIVFDTTTIVSDTTTTVFDMTTTVVDTTTCANKRHKEIGEKGPCRGQIVSSAPVKSRTTSTKEPVSFVRPPRYDFDIPSRPQYFEDDDEENSEEYSERDEECEEHEEGADDRGEHGEEAKVESEQTISERGGPGELKGGLGIEYEDEGQEEETTGEGGYAQRLPSGHGHWGADRGRGGMHHEVTVVSAHTHAARLTEKKRKIRQERRSDLDSKRTKQEGGTKQEECHKRKLKLLPVDEAVRRTREAEEAMKKKRQPRKKAAKGGVMEKTFVFPADHPQSDEDAVGKTFTRPPCLQILSPGNYSGHLSKNFFIEFDENGNQRPEMQFISVKFDRILDIPAKEFRYNQRFLGQQHIDDIYDAMVESGEAAIRERTIGAATVNLSGRDAVKPATKQGESRKAPRPGPGFESVKGVRVPVHWIQGTRGPDYLVVVHDPDVRSWKAMSTLGRRERLQLLRDILAGSVILAPKLSKVAHIAGKHSKETYVKMVKLERAMLRMFHYFVFISDPHKQPSEWKEPFFDNLSDVFARYSDQGLTSKRWIDQRQHFKDMSWVRSFSTTLGGEDEKGEEGFKKTKSLAEKCPEEFIQFVNKLLRRSETGGSRSIRMSGQAKYMHFQKQGVTSVLVPFQ
ncbi:hypothetical protein CBR_g37730 [Chara braunii]|uniref:Uncharacterized protein n=1 Tax=Chara braunii TaxID=69332 RepID=A0A388K007_CHABU|nr:hypothetical protein CBR_g37730 [Chara braunii]|eukprot:GBG63372.1 hypothetical protein CBR_g37730 [Chara braunii]